jgi:hypothetical protein
VEVGAGAGVVVVLGEDVGLDLGLGEEKGGGGEQESCGEKATGVEEGQSVVSETVRSGAADCTRVKGAV